jgi:hypothetical protein
MRRLIFITCAFAAAAALAGPTTGKPDEFGSDKL